MPDRQPTESTNLDIYGDAPLPWSRPRDLLEAGPGTKWRDPLAFRLRGTQIWDS